MSPRTLLSAYSDLPELKGKSPAEQRRLVWQAGNRRGDAIWAIPLLVAVSVVGVWGGIGFGIVRMVMAWKASKSPLGQAETPMDLVRLIALGGLFLFLASFVLTKRAMLIRSLITLVNRAACPYCRFSLVGLKPDTRGGTGAKPSIRCPECGEVVSIFDHGILPDDLLTDHDRRKPLPGAGPYGAYKTPPRTKSRSTKPTAPPARK